MMLVKLISHEGKTDADIIDGEWQLLGQNFRHNSNQTNKKSRFA